MYKVHKLKNPYIVNSFASLILSAGGDILCQKVIERKTNYDVKRTIIMSTYSFFIFSPYCTFINELLLKVKFNNALSFNKCLFYGVLGNIISNPPLNYFIIHYKILCHNIIDKGSSFEYRNFIKESKQKISEVYVNTCVNSALFWIPFNVLNLKFIPYRFRVISTLIMTSTWASYISFVNYN